jgi:hypothetical protein
MVKHNQAWLPKLKDEMQEIGNFPLNLVAIINTLIMYFHNKYAITLVRKQKSYFFPVITASWSKAPIFLLRNFSHFLVGEPLTYKNCVPVTLPQSRLLLIKLQ